MALTADQIRELLHLKPHPIEGGHFIETYRSPLFLGPDALGTAYSGQRSLATAIFYLLTPNTFSEMHKLPGDELFHFYLGDPVEMLQLRSSGTGDVIHLGHDLASGMHLQHCVPGGDWQGSRLVPGGQYALLGTTMSPGFDFADYVTGRRDELRANYPGHSEMIASLTR